MDRKLIFVENLNHSTLIWSKLKQNITFNRMLNFDIIFNKIRWIRMAASDLIYLILCKNFFFMGSFARNARCRIGHKIIPHDILSLIFMGGFSTMVLLTLNRYCSSLEKYSVGLFYEFRKNSIILR